MRPVRISRFGLAAFLALCGLVVFYLWGLPAVPFHPDESTQLYMSADIELFFQSPLDLAWRPELAGDLRQHYRLIDAPLTRYLLGLGRLAAGISAPPADWDWGGTWAQNQASGALPEPAALNTGRFTLTLLLPLSLVLIYAIGRKISGNTGPWTGLLAALLLGLQALALLHNRRAMAEGPLIFASLLALWSFIKMDQRPALGGLAMAVAFAAKQTTLALLPVGLLAAIWQPEGGEIFSSEPGLPLPTRLWKQWGLPSIQFLTAFALLTLALNPFLWRYPLPAARASWEERQDLLEQQVADTGRLAPEKLLETPSRRAAVILANLYITPLSFFEVGNYRLETAPSEAAYLKIPGHNLLRGLFAGGILFALTLAGLALGIIRARIAPAAERRVLVLLILAAVSQFVLLLLVVPLPWQRYAIPLLPYACLWPAYAIGSLLDRRQAMLSNHLPDQIPSSRNS